MSDRNPQLPESLLDDQGNLKVLFRYGFKIVELDGEQYAEAMTEQELKTVAEAKGHGELLGGCVMTSSGWCNNKGCDGTCEGIYDAQYWYCICD